jgi:hypothetical protein
MQVEGRSRLRHAATGEGHGTQAGLQKDRFCLDMAQDRY